MPTYIYETIPKRPGARTRQFECQQSMKDPPLTHDPETGEPVRRVIGAGFVVVEKARAPRAKSPHHDGHPST